MDLNLSITMQVKGAIYFLLFVSLTGAAQTKKGSSYQYTLDLTTVVDDKVHVQLVPPAFTQNEVTFYMPKMIPGTYAIEDYGRFVSNLEALDKKGRKLPVEKLTDNSWKLTNATKVKTISYWIEDSFDTQLAGPNIFQPAGTNIEEGKNYIINSSGYFGYFDNAKEIPFTVNIIRPKTFYGSTGLIASKTNEPLALISKEKSSTDDTKRVDVFQTENYDRLVDSPMMYAAPDTAIIKVGNAEVLIGSYSPNKKISAREIANSVREVLQAQKEYLGGQLPVNKYAFIFYFTDQPVTSYGALEHSYSSFYYMPERTITQMNAQLRDFVAHEFFHIVTPLTIHSEEIGKFDFNNPKMSRHLWLYEGVTEYFAGNVQVKYGLITPEQYLTVIQQKMVQADRFIDNLAFTDLSLGALDKYENQYQNVYLKGALIGMCLDIQLRKLSAGKYGMQNLVADLGKKYGKDKAFNDPELFDEITKLTYPEIGVFLKTYVSGNTPLPYAAILSLAGVMYKAEVIIADYNIGIVQRAISYTMADGKPDKFTIANADALNDQGRALGFKNGDIVLKINGEDVPGILDPELVQFLDRHQKAMGEGKTLSYTVSRKNAQGVAENVELKAEAIKVERKQYHVISFDPNATPEQLAVRNAWLKPQ
jgi:predicted metalloprotease with PDZ domain